MNIVFIGAGNMADALVAGLLRNEIASPEAITVTDISPERLRLFREKYGVRTESDNLAAAKRADVLVPAVKPQVFPEIWPPLRDALGPDVLVVSIMAGIPTARIAGDRPLRVVRVMPNTPALVGEGAAGVAPGEYATEDDLAFARRMMEGVGIARVVSEADIDAVTALSGSGPAYVFYLLESMIEAARRMGLEEETARDLALQTVSGAARLMRETGEEAAELRRRVTSPGGTTAAALRVLEEHNVKEAFIEALLAARNRSRELADG